MLTLVTDPRWYAAFKASRRTIARWLVASSLLACAGKDGGPMEAALQAILFVVWWYADNLQHNLIWGPARLVEGELPSPSG